MGQPAFIGVSSILTGAFCGFIHLQQRYDSTGRLGVNFNEEGGESCGGLDQGNPDFADLFLGGEGGPPF